MTKSSRFGWNAVLLVLLGTAPVVTAQTELWRYDGVDQDPIGVFVTGLGDVNADGVPDVLAGEQAYLTDCAAVVISGADGQVLHAVRNMSVGSLSSVGDLDGDGRDDYLIGDFFNGEVRVCSGASGATLYQYFTTWEVKYGHSVAGLGDLDGDGIDDFAFSGVRSLYKNDVSVHSGADGSQMYEFNGFKNYQIGTDVASAGDVDGDGTPDILVSGQDPVRVFSGARGKVILSVSGDPTGGFGWAAAGVGDLNGDGLGDLVISDPFDDTNGTDAGAVFVISGLDGSILASLYGRAAGDRFGDVVGGGGDVNGDGLGDFLVGAPRASETGTRSGSATLVSGAGFVPLYDFHGEADYHGLGTSVALGGDVDGDGLVDPILGSPGATNPQGDGRVTLVRGARYFLRLDPPVVQEGAPLAIQSGQGVPGRSGSLYVVAVNGAPLFQRLSRQTLAGDGTMSLQASIPVGLSGTQIDFLAMTIDAGGRVVLTSAETLTVQ